MLILFTGRTDTKSKRLYRNKPSGVANVVISLDFGLNSNWWYPHLRSNLLKTLEPFMVCNTSSTVGIGYRIRMIAWFACLVSTHKRISLLFFGMITGPSTGSIISMSNSSVVLSRIFPLRLNGILLKGCAIGFTVGSISSGICFVFQFSDTLKYLWILLY